MKHFENIKAILFDLDGTILDTAGDICAAALHAVQYAGFPSFDPAGFTNLIGYGIASIYHDILPEGTPEEIINKALQEHLRYYPEHCMEQTHYFPEAEETLKELARRGIKMAIITSKIEETSVELVKHYCSDIPFLEVWGNNQVRPLKPDVKVGKMACEALDITPEETLFVGDGDADMRFARNMGFGAVGVSWGYRTVDVLKANGADVILDHFSQLLEII